MVTATTSKWLETSLDTITSRLYVSQFLKYHIIEKLQSFLYFGSSQTSLPVILYPFSTICQQKSQPPEPLQSILRLTSSPCFRVLCPETVKLEMGSLEITFLLKKPIF